MVILIILEPGKAERQWVTHFKDKIGEELRVPGEANKNHAYQLLESKTAQNYIYMSRTPVRAT